jgi:hypothetical protein
VIGHLRLRQRQALCELADAELALVAQQFEIRSRIGSPSPRKYLATRSLATGEAGRRNGDGPKVTLTALLYHAFLMYYCRAGHG